MNKLAFVERIKAVIDRTYHVYSVVKTIDTWSPEKVKSYIDESFYNIVNYCYQHVPYYHRLFNDYSLDPKQFTSIGYISKIPVLTKEIIRNNYEKLRSDELHIIKYQDRRSGGTTGEPIRSLVSREAAAFETFSYFKGLAWMGWKPDMTFVKIFGGSLGLGIKANLRQRMYLLSTNAISIPAFELNSDTISNYYDVLKGKKGICLIGYASAINILVELLKSKGLTLKNIILVITTSEQLIDDWRDNIKSYFNCEVRSYYGCGEIGSLGYQIYNGDQSYRIPKEHVHIENDNLTNELYITQLHNKAQPLLRYANGDLGSISTHNPWSIENFYGRTADLFIRKDKVKVSPNFGAHAILHSRIPVLQYQYIQYSNNVIEFRYIMESGELKSEHKTILQNIIDYVMGEHTEVHFVQNQSFETSKSGKHRITVTVNRPFDKPKP